MGILFAFFYGLILTPYKIVTPREDLDDHRRCSMTNLWRVIIAFGPLGILYVLSRKFNPFSKSVISEFIDNQVIFGISFLHWFLLMPCLFNCCNLKDKTDFLVSGGVWEEIVEEVEE